ncbi:CbbQ/NirQ/NorQ/GpvN family protein [uncultured Bdellovibrio sp.]|uniref:CbbQ/NirQ/NorQ/GpvN family protein n=1 Tax=Bdellovibrio sp. HCB-162 TaxID=3394234 RepID=UPI0025F0A8D5|nr:CbbQ/NirQ/NorQ/GpvN family protein [uncultured Bdellovibrio sp.]
MLAPTIKGPFYQVVADEEEIFDSAYRNQLPLMLKGPTGCGKSRFIESMAARRGRPLITVACNEDTSATDLLGRFVVKGGDTVWQDGPVTRALREGAILYLDEIAEAREDVIVVLHPLTDHRRAITLDKLNEEIKASPEFMLVVSFNPGYQRGLKELKPSTRQRFVAMHFDYPRPELESEIVKAESQCSLEVAQKLVRFAGKIRNLKELGLAETASTRLLVDAGKLIRDGLEPRRSCDVAIVQPLTDDGDIMTALQDVAAMIF